MKLNFHRCYAMFYVSYRDFEILEKENLAKCN